jgi:predicted nucleotidyltransferase
MAMICKTAANGYADCGIENEGRQGGLLESYWGKVAAGQSPLSLAARPISVYTERRGGTAVPISPDKMETYRATARQSWVEERRRLALRHECAWAIARQAADLLRTEYGADRVTLFGSLVRSELFHTGSDIDLAVWGLDEKHYYRAVARLLALDPAFEIDLVMGEEIPASLLAGIEKEGTVI